MSAMPVTQKTCSREWEFKVSLEGIHSKTLAQREVRRKGNRKHDMKAVGGLFRGRSGIEQWGKMDE